MTRNMDALLQAASSELCRFLANLLPQIGDKDWWTKQVIDKLSFQQQRFVEQRKIKDLRGLDLAALLRVLDRNWYEIGWKLTFPSDARHFVKELMSVRNRWAHASVEEFSRDDVYRDLDTLQRFLMVIGASEQLQGNVQGERKKLLEEQETPALPTAPVSTDDEERTALIGFQSTADRPTEVGPLKTWPRYRCSGPGC